MRPKIGFIGVGIMGLPMAGHLVKAGYDLVAYDIIPESMDAAVAMGAERGLSCADVAARADVIISMVPDSPDVEAVALGPGGIHETARQGQVYIDMSTIAPAVARRVAGVLGARGVRCLDAPVSGGDVGAKNAALSIMVGGDKALFEEVLPILEVMGNTIILCGGNGAGQTVKACNQIQVALNFVGMAEALVLGAKAGVDPAIVVEVLSGGYAQTRVMDVRGPRIVRGDFEPGFRSKFHYKDLNIIMETAKENLVSLPATAVAHELFSALLASGGGDLDHSAVITVLESLSGVTARTGAESQCDND
jgi:2-hydroxy-3-oxopropionate reductase